MILASVLLFVGFAVLIKGADWLVNGSVSLARQYKVSELAIGLTIVAFGTSAPELVVNIISSTKGYGDVTLGNVVGSNLFNLMLIGGLAGIIYPLTVNSKTIWKEIPFSLLAVILLLILSNFTFNQNGASINRIDGGILLVFFALFMWYIFKNLKSGDDSMEEGDYKAFSSGKSIGFIVLGLACLVGGSHFVVENAVLIARSLGASEKVIGVTIISAGTSLPELVTSVVAATKRKSDIAIGNIIGSNIFNIFLILGVSSLIAPIQFNASFNTDYVLLIVSTIALFAFMFSGVKHKLDRWEAAVLMAGYVAYIIWLLM